MLAFDKQITNLVQNLGGLYMRYSDDFIVIIPDDCDFVAAQKQIDTIINSVPRLELKPEKTKIFYHDAQKNHVECVTSKYLPEIADSKDTIEYLGLAYDGKNVRIKDASKFKFLNRANKKVKSILNQRECFGFENVGSKNFRLRYTSAGAKGYEGKNKEWVNGNFITYERRVHKKIGEVFSDLGEPQSIEDNLGKMIKKLGKPKRDMLY